MSQTHGRATDRDQPNIPAGRTYWTLVRLRTEVAGINLMLILTNGLIFELLAALIF
jgi:hypothetical protein